MPINVFASQNTSKQTAMKNTHEKAESMDLTAEHRNLILTANKVFGEDKWSHTVVNQTLGTYYYFKVLSI